MLLTKTDIFVTINSEDKQKRAIEILEKHGEKIWDAFCALRFDETCKYLVFDTDDSDWYIGCSILNLTEITLDQLDELLTESN